MKWKCFYNNASNCCQILSNEWLNYLKKTNNFFNIIEKNLCIFGVESIATLLFRTPENLITLMLFLKLVGSN